METLSVLKDTPIPTLLVIGGIVLLILSIASKVGGKIEISSSRQNISIALGIILLLIGVALYLIPTANPKSNDTNSPYPSVMPILYYYVNVDEAKLYEEKSESSRAFETITRCTQVEVVPEGYDPDWLHVTYTKGTKRITGYALTKQFTDLPCESTITPIP